MISNRWKLSLAALPIIGTLALAQPQPGGLGGFFSAWWGSQSLWTPASLTGLVVWIDSSDNQYLAISNGLLRELTDKAGNFTATQNTESAMATINTTERNLPVIAFDGTNDNLRHSFSLGTNASTTFSVHRRRPEGPLNVQAIHSYAPPNTPLVNAIAAKAANFEMPGAYFSGIFWFHAGITNTNWLIIASADTGTESTGINRVFRFYGNGAETRSLTNYSYYFDATDRRAIGGYSGEYFAGFLAENIVVRGVLSASDRQKTEGYLAHKWDLTVNLPTNHPYKTRPPLKTD